MSLSMTEKAADHVKNYLAKRGKGVGVRVGIKTTGCSGMAYVLEFVDEENHEDKVFTSHGVNLYADDKSLAYLSGTELDFVKEGLNEGFQFNNPNVKDECGCGESFNRLTKYKFK